jgi:lipoprotein
MSKFVSIFSLLIFATMILCACDLKANPIKAKPKDTKVEFQFQPETVTEVYLDKDGSHKIVLSSGKKILADQVRDFRKDKNNQEVSLTSKVVSRKDKFNGEDFEERFIFIHDRVQDEKDFSLAKEHEVKTSDTVVD